MSASGDGTQWISKLNSVASVQDLDGALTRLLFLPIAAFFVQAANAVEAISNVIIDPLGAFGTGLGSIVNSILGGTANIVSSGSAASASDVPLFGIGAFPVALGIAFGSAFIIANYLQQPETSDLIPLSFTDIPGLGVEETPEEE